MEVSLITKGPAAALRKFPPRSCASSSDSTSLAQRFVVPAGLPQKSEAFSRLVLQGLVIELVNMLPTLGSHRHGGSWFGFRGLS